MSSSTVTYTDVDARGHFETGTAWKQITDRVLVGAVTHNEQVTTYDTYEYSEYVGDDVSTVHVTASHYEWEDYTINWYGWEWEDTSYDVQETVYDPYEYSFYVGTEVETVHVAAGHWENQTTVDYESHSVWVDTSHWEYTDYNEYEQVYVYDGYWEDEVTPVIHNDNVWVDDSYDYEVYKPVYATETRYVSHVETRHVEEGHWDFHAIPHTAQRLISVDDSYDYQVYTPVYETGVRTVAHTTTVQITDVPGHWEERTRLVQTSTQTWIDDNSAASVNFNNLVRTGDKFGLEVRPLVYANAPKYRVSNFPTTLVVDSKGNLHYTFKDTSGENFIIAPPAGRPQTIGELLSSTSDSSDQLAITSIWNSSTQLSMSQDYLGFLESLYHRYLGRASDADGLNWWNVAMQNGASAAQVEADFANCAEAASYNSRLEATVTTTYQQELGRNPDSGGLAYYVAALRNGYTESAMRQEIHDSPEAQTYRSSQATSATNPDPAVKPVNPTNWAPQLQAIFQRNLGRNIDPQALLFWTSALDNGKTLSEVEDIIGNSREAKIFAWKDYEMYSEEAEDANGPVQIYFYRRTHSDGPGIELGRSDQFDWSDYPMGGGYVGAITPDVEFEDAFADRWVPTDASGEVSSTQHDLAVKIEIMIARGATPAEIIRATENNPYYKDVIGTYLAVDMSAGARTVQKTEAYTSLSELDQSYGLSGKYADSKTKAQALANTKVSKDLQAEIEKSPEYSAVGRVLAGMGLSDSPGNIGITVVMPQGDKPGFDTLRALQDRDTGSLKAGVTWSDFVSAAAAAGVPMVYAENGITNSPSQAYGNSYSLSRENANQNKDVLVVSAYNPTTSENLDSVEAGMIKLGVDTAAVAASRIMINRLAEYNAGLAKVSGDSSLAFTQVWGHSEGAAIVTEALNGRVSADVRSKVDVFVFGDPVGVAPEGLHKFVDVGNRNDMVAQLGRLVTLTGGVEESAAYKKANQANKDSYRYVEANFKVNSPDGGREWNHSWQYYLSDPVTRAAFQLGSLSPELQKFYSRSSWLKGE